MVPNSGDRRENEIQESNICQAKDEASLSIQSSVRSSEQELSGEITPRKKFLNFIHGLPKRTRLRRFGPSSSIKFRQMTMQRDEFSRSVHSGVQTSRDHTTRLPLVKKIDWGHLWALSKEWIKDPLNMVLLVWILGVTVSGAILFMVMIGMLNHALPSKSQRNAWFEVNNQILNALFTLMCLYQHPKRIYHFVLLCRWQPKDILKLRKIYCKNGTYKPNEWVHMMVVVALLNLNCFAQYALCSLNLGYKRSERPAIGVGLCVSVAIAAPAFASVYNILSPLGRDYDIEIDQEAQSGIAPTDSTRPSALRLKTLEKMYSFVPGEDRRLAESRPEWVGGVCDFWDDISLAYLSIFCSCCVFGWNMQRLGFGNMYVHIATFLLFCLAPFFIFNLAAVNINDEVVQEVLGVTGILLCILGLLYGGFWRIQMRKRYNLPDNKFCCGNPSVTDCFLWLCCCSCSLSQEVRTADYYDIMENTVQTERMTPGTQYLLSPLPREDGLPLFRSEPSSPQISNKPSPQSVFTPSRFSGATPERSLQIRDKMMKPPAPSVIQRDGD